jgi:prophage tail gpP-like protein
MNSMQGFLAGAMLFSAHAAGAQTPVDPGTATSFAVLAGSGITIAASGTTPITGDVDSYPAATVTGTKNLTLNGINHWGDAVSLTAQTDLFAA